MIYKCMFVRQDCEIAFDFFKTSKKKKNDSIWAKAGEQLPNGHPEYVNNEKLDLSVLLACQQISSETRAIIYGSNKFAFANMTVLGDFLRQIGPCKKYLRTIRLLKLTLPSKTGPLLAVSRTAQNLSTCPNLISLRFGSAKDWSPVDSLLAVDSMIDLFGPLFAAIYARKKAVEDVSVVVGFNQWLPAFNTPHPFSGCAKWTGSEYALERVCKACLVEEKAFGKYKAELKKAIVRYLHSA